MRSYPTAATSWYLPLPDVPQAQTAGTVIADGRGLGPPGRASQGATSAASSPGCTEELGMGRMRGIWEPPQGLLYVPDLITAPEEERLLGRLRHASS